MCGIAFIDDHLPNTVTIQATPGAAAYVVLASDGNVYSSVANLKAAGKTVAPGLDPGGRPKKTVVGARTAADAAHGGFWICFDPPGGTATDANSFYVQPGQTYTKNGPWRLVWVKMKTGTDILDVQFSH